MAMTRKPTGRLCRIIGCDSILGRWFEWPHRVCGENQHLRRRRDTPQYRPQRQS